MISNKAQVYINDDPGLTLTYFMARSNWDTCMFEWGKLLQSHLMEENLQQRTRVEPPWEVGEKVYINGTSHMTKMTTMLIYGKNLQKSNKS